jgi:hypothetical protein
MGIIVDELNLIESPTRPPSGEYERDDADRKHEHRGDGNDGYTGRKQERRYRDQQPETDVHPSEVTASTRLAVLSDRHKCR